MSCSSKAETAATGVPFGPCSSEGNKLLLLLKDVGAGENGRSPTPPEALVSSEEFLPVQFGYNDSCILQKIRGVLEPILMISWLRRA